MRRDVDDLKEKRLAERVALGLCWVDGGMLNAKPTPTVISIDAPISDEHKSELMAVLRKIEFAHAQTQKERE
jgi:hypothetical protein